MTSRALALTHERTDSRGDLVVATLLTGVVASLLLALGPAPGDAPVHLYRTLLVHQGAWVWDNFWYAGHYPLFSYSLLYYLPAAVVGNTPLALAAALASTLLFSGLAFREWGSVALWPTRVFGVIAAAPMFTGLYSYSLGFAALLGTLRALQSRKTTLGIVLATLTFGFSPLAFVFLCLVLGSVFAARRRFTTRATAVLVAIGAVALLEVGLLVAFPAPGVYPFHPIDLVSLLGVSALGALVARSARNGAPFVAFFLLWGLGSLVLFTLHTPIGDNWTRLNAFIFPLMLLVAGLAGFRPPRLVVLALAAALAYNLVPYLLLIPYRMDGRPAQRGFWQTPITFLRDHSAPGYRAEIVPTAAHWESYWLPRAGLPLARGFYTQLDRVDNAPLYSKHLDGAAYQRWLRANAVEYVVLPPTKLDRGTTREARLLRSGRSGLELAYDADGWMIWRLPRPSPLLTGPGVSRVTFLGHSTIEGWVSAPGRYLLRAHYTRYWTVSGGCIHLGPGKMVWLDFAAPGRFTLAVATTPEGLLDTATAGAQHGC